MQNPEILKMIPTIHIENASLQFNETVIFSNLSFSLESSKWVALLGPSGVGKSSLLQMIAGLKQNNSQLTLQINAQGLKPLHSHIAYMAQTDLLIPWYNAFDNVILSLKLRNVSRQVKIKQKQKAEMLFKLLQLENAKHLFPKALSGGMRQRVALIRTLIEEKPIVLMDEPFSAVDAITRYQLQTLAAKVLKDKTVLFITHDPTEALRLAHVIMIMEGRPAALKTVAQLNSPIPRSLNEPEIITWQEKLYQALSMS